MNHLRHQKYKNKQLHNTRFCIGKEYHFRISNNFKPTTISVKDMGKLEKKTNAEENIY